MIVLGVLLLASSLALSDALPHRARSKKDPRLSASNRALNLFATCCSDHECKELHFSDLLSGLYNYAALSKEAAPKTYYRTLEIAHECNIQPTLRQKLQALRQSCPTNTNGPCVVQRVILEFQAKRWNVVVRDDPATPTLPALNVSLERYLTASNHWSPIDSFSIVTDDQHPTAPQMSQPSAATLDHALVIGWAARRSGHGATGWSSLQELLKHINRIRPHYQRHLVGLVGVVGDDDGGASTGLHVGQVEANGDISTSAVRDLVWMAMHVVYVVSEFGLWAVRYEEVVPEVKFLNSIIPHAMATNDADMLGEVLDCLNAVHVEEVGGGGGGGGMGNGGRRRNTRQRDRVLFNVDSGLEFLVANQGFDGSFSEREHNPEYWHTVHVAGLALLPRPRQRPVSTVEVHIGNEEFWQTASAIIPPLSVLKERIEL